MKQITQTHLLASPKRKGADSLFPQRRCLSRCYRNIRFVRDWCCHVIPQVKMWIGYTICWESAQNRSLSEICTWKRNPFLGSHIYFIALWVEIAWNLEDLPCPLCTFALLIRDPCGCAASRNASTNFGEMRKCKADMQQLSH